MILAGTGHRKIGSRDGWTPLSRAVVCRMGDELDRLQPTRVISGMALGVDQWLARLALKRDIPVTAAVPCRGQDAKWLPRQVTEYRGLMGLVTDIVYVTDGPYDPGCMQRRNEYMVDRCDVLLAVWDGSNGGTANCVRYAETVGRTIVRIDPRELGG